MGGSVCVLSLADWRDRCPQEGGSAAAGGWHPPNQVLREIKALQEMEDNQYMSEAGPWRPFLPPAFPTIYPLNYFSTWPPSFTQLLRSSLLPSPIHTLIFSFTHSFIH